MDHGNAFKCKEAKVSKVTKVPLTKELLPQTKHHSGPPSLSPSASALHQASFESATAVAVLTLNEMAEASWWAPPACLG